MVRRRPEGAHGVHRSLFPTLSRSPPNLTAVDRRSISGVPSGRFYSPHVMQECKELWRERKEALWSLMGLYPDLECMVTDVCVPVSRLADLIGGCKRELDKSPLPAPIVAHAVRSGHSGFSGPIKDYARPSRAQPTIFHLYFCVTLLQLCLR